MVEHKRTVLITGSSKGLGKSLALAYSARGYNIILHGRDQASLNMVREKVLANKVDCHLVIGDVVEEQTIADLTACADEFKVDILVNNAGVYIQKPIDQISAAELRRVIDVNLISPLLLTKNIFELFKKRLTGLIININSLAGKDSSAHESAYSASKHGIRGFMRSFQFEALKHNVSIVDVYLGAISTDMTADRNNRDKFIQKDEVADFLCTISQNYMSMRVNEIEILRKLY